MQEETPMRERLMNEANYAPTCGKRTAVIKKCEYGFPKSSWNPDKEQFTCKCGWVSHFPKDFIIRYRQKWGK